jgi:hypothetical protein
MSLSTGALRVLASEHAALMDDVPKSLLTEGTANPKVGKGEKRGYRTAIMHLSPGNLAGFETCAGRTVGCFAACLNTAGRGGMATAKPSEIHVARMRRTRYFKRDRRGFGLMLERELEGHLRKAARADLIPVVRLNGTSDLPWENVRFTWRDGSRSTVFERFPDVQFYDYTKVIRRLREPLPANYDLTFSLAESNAADADEAIRLGFRVAVVMRNRERPSAKVGQLPTEWNGTPVVDADESDLRFLEPAGVYCGLRAKGLAKTDTSGFVHDV